jgi:hypothetical protein
LNFLTRFITLGSKALAAKGVKNLAAGFGYEACNETGLLRLEAALSG